MDYRPDKWVVIKITNKETAEVHYRVFATWYGGYCGSDSWKMNSGIVSVVKRGGFFEFSGESGSVYFCHENCWGTSGYGQSILDYYTNNTEQAMIEVLPEDIDLLSIKYQWSCTK